MKKEQVNTNQMAVVTSKKPLGQVPNEKTSPPNPKTRMDTGKLVWKGSPLSKDLLMRLIERVQES